MLRVVKCVLNRYGTVATNYHSSNQAKITVKALILIGLEAGLRSLATEREVPYSVMNLRDMFTLADRSIPIKMLVAGF